MPAGAGTASQFAVWINLQGQVNPSVNRSIGTTTKMLKGLQLQAAAVNKTLAAVGKTVGSIAGIAGGLLAIGGLTAGMEQSIALARQSEQLQEQMLVLFKNERIIRGQNIDLAQKDLQLITDQSEALQQQTGIYKNVYQHGAMIFAQTHRTTGEIKSMQYSMANLLVSQRMQGKSAEELEQVYTAVGKAIQTGMARNLNSVGVFLTPIQKQLLMIHAKMSDFGANIRIIEDAINRTYGGLAKTRMGTLLGQSDLAMANMQESMEKMGKAMLPVQLRLQMIFAKIVPQFEPLVVKLANMADNFLQRHMKDLDKWIGFLQKTAIPTMIIWIDKGWNALMKAVKWFRQNSDWIMPFLKGAAVGFAAVTAAIVALTVAAAALSQAFNPALWGALLGGLVGLFRSKGREISEFLFGTKESIAMFGPRKALPKKAKSGWFPYQESGWIDRMLKPINKAIDNFFNTTLPGWINTAWKTVTNGVKWIWDTCYDWIKQQVGNAWDWFHGILVQGWNNTVNWVTDKLMALGKAIKDYLLTPWNMLNDSAKDFKKALQDLGDEWNREWGAGKGGSAAGGLPGHIPYAKGHGQPSATNSKYNIPSTIAAPDNVNRATRITHYGYEKYGDPDWDYNSAHWIGAGRPLTHAYNPTGTTSVALMDRLAAKWGVRKGDTFTYVTPSGNRYTMLYEDRVPGGHKVHGKWVPYPENRMDIFDPYNKYRGDIQGGGHIENIQHEGKVTINYNVHHNHNGGTADTARLASIHRQHVEDIRRAVQEAKYRSDRQNFDGAYAV